MSSTEIYGFRKSGYAFHLADITNAWLGAMSVWTFLERKYLPSLPIPSWCHRPENREYFSRTTDMITGSGKSAADPMKEIWGLIKDPRVKRRERICLATTFDNGIVMRNDFIDLVDALYTFPGVTNLREQAAIIDNAPGYVEAIGWNQTSVNGDTWLNAGIKGKPYNFLKQQEHFLIFELDEIKNVPKETLEERLGLNPVEK